MKTAVNMLAVRRKSRQKQILIGVLLLLSGLALALAVVLLLQPQFSSDSNGDSGSKLTAYKPQAATSPQNQIPVTRVLEPFALVDQSGQRFDMTQLRGKTVLLNFVYTSCSVSCPIVSRELIQLQQSIPAAYRDRLQLLSVTVDPLNDNPKRLQAFASKLGVDHRNWAWLSGDVDVVSLFTKRFQAFDLRKGDAVRPVDHITSLILLDAEGRPTMRYRGPDFDQPRVLRELMELDDLYGPQTRLSLSSRSPSAVVR
ncbi:MAG: SCO family protein [Aquabacterium sp.]|nr:SCO family protein [Aquabacterium sp.]